ncbi:unnamed protein product [Urochloa decumbens]|uniref:Wax synthase domain-containing protein n=1 Tax=Urochloa decumbens TaxID=240449 RepID=A0ABC9D5J3_9POAL
MAAGGDLRSLAAVVAATTACMAYARFAARRLRPGLPRLAALLPVLAFLPFLPLAFRALHPRAISAFFLAWVAEFRLLLLAAGQGPLHPSLSLPAFVAIAVFPVTRREDSRKTKNATAARPGLGLAESAAMAALLAAIVSLEERASGYALLALYSLHVYLALELVLASSAAAARALLGVDLEPQFDRPYLSSSLRDFWGRRWNLAVSALLRDCVFLPVRARLGSGGAAVPAAVLVAFFVSGLMHEAMFSYITLQPPTGEALAFFALHGACAVAEGWWAKQHERRWPRPPRAVAAPLTVAFVGVTAFWLFFPPITRPGADKQVVAESEAMVAFMKDAAGWAAASARSILSRPPPLVG